CAMTGDYW
nr:immunoglobulin heavy chain junction region [Mus musculus]NSM05422.1 immunoglobulin heavy chain junction region [Mus musculus]NSM06303.1 immunoglobulin heavy chain junction region [Mus musculus]NSM07015.1 immunoglobulin heavy chain junction region [Mus musculus]NSM07018.1 immunoglobulin heavy chain junction region [Mus musculus]